MEWYLFCWWWRKSFVGDVFKRNKWCDLKEKRRSSKCVLNLKNKGKRINVKVCEWWGFKWDGEIYVGWIEEKVNLCNRYEGIK